MPATTPLAHVRAVAQLAAIPLVMAAPMIIEDLPGLRQTRSTALHAFGRTPPPSGA